MAKHIFKRVEKKYLIDCQQLELILTEIKQYIKPDDYTGYSIFNIYYDTVDNLLIRNSIEKPVYKEKLRVRSYNVPSDTDNVFIEIKKKFNGVVYKRRMSIPYGVCTPYLNGEEMDISSQISKEIDYFVKFYNPVPKLFIAYERDCYAGILEQDLRITVDKNIRSRDYDLNLSFGGDGESLLPDNMRLIEIKTETAYPLWLTSVLNKYKIYPTSFSKYGNIYKSNILQEVI